MLHIGRLRRGFRRRSLRLVLAARVHLRRVRVRLRTKVAGSSFLVPTMITSLGLALMASGLIYLKHVKWHADSEPLVTNGTLPQLEIAVGAAVLGVIGIVFSLSIFSVQQVAERGTAYTVQEYARDWVFRITYWALALFALAAMLSALQKKELGAYGIYLNFGILLASVLVLKIYFDRVIKFVDPHFTISKVANRAKILLTRIQKVESAVRDEIRYQRGRRNA
jgi:uncharacterized membrane protein